MVQNITAFPLDQNGFAHVSSFTNTVPFLICYNPFLVNTQKWPKSLRVAVFIFCDLLQESNLVSSAAVCVASGFVWASGFVMSIWSCVHVCIYAHIHTYTCIIYTLYIWIYIRGVYTFIHNIVYLVSTGDKLNWVRTLARVYLSPAPSAHFKQYGASVHFLKCIFNAE